VFLISNASATISPVHNMEPHGASATMWLLCTNNVGFRGALQHASVDGGLHFSAIFVGNRCLYITWKLMRPHDIVFYSPQSNRIYMYKAFC